MFDKGVMIRDCKSLVKEEALTKHAFFLGKIVPIDQAKVSVMTHALHYGTSCFGALRGYWNQEKNQLYVFRIRDHYTRFLDSAKLLMMKLPYSVDDLVDVTLTLLREEGWREDVYIRPLAYKADPRIGCQMHNVGDDLTIFSLPYGSYMEHDTGARVTFSSWQRVSDNAIPPRGKIGGAYVNSALIKSDAILKGFDEALVLNPSGHVAEGSAENVFILRKGRAITPPVSEGILEGITRQTVMELLRSEMRIDVIERSIDRTEVYLADEVFLCGTGVQVVAVTQVDQWTIGNGEMGPTVKALRDLYFRIVRGSVEQYLHWCTPAYAK